MRQWTMTDPALPLAEFAFPGPLRDTLVSAILSGSKTTTTSLVLEYQIEEEDLPSVGARQAVIDSSGVLVAVIETVAVEQVQLRHVPLRHAIDEGEGQRTVEQWRVDHEAFWHSREMRESLQDATFTVDDDTFVVLERFRLVMPL